ncbi:DUF4328 domain-containing protein [Streptomyces sp. LHD-70]|uniref:DUF4328 domain-containing protein n=1 Tax=Streptomyces sp. LHD-70 TaxID=3072140 RepID=UPI00280CD198|nr:DUF4328 domain-containing protein [Streptomyces sp. LHD-70]MDQ8704719.1 DUF4328 domain-containing protein [Streptomyces sp. LHD-70]
MILLTLAGNMLVTVSDWRAYLVVRAYAAGAATMPDVEAAHTFAVAVAVATVPVVPATYVVFLVWLWLVRVNSELWAGPAAHRRARGWVIASWMTPVANLWFPYQVVSDICQASAPRRPALRGPLKAWWALFVAATVVGRTLGGFYGREEITLDVLRSTAAMSTVSMVLELAAGALIILIVHRITGWQNERLTGA